MVTRNVVRYQNASGVARRAAAAGARGGGLEDIRAGLREGLAQAVAGDLALGSGADAVRRAFDRARTELTTRSG